MKTTQKYIFSIVLTVVFMISVVNSTQIKATAVEVDWQTIYADKIYELLADLGTNYSQSEEKDFQVWISTIELANLNFDSIPELIVYGDPASKGYSVVYYTVVNGIAQPFLRCGGNPSNKNNLFENDGFLQLVMNNTTGEPAYILHSSSGNYEHYNSTYYTIENSTSLNTKSNSWRDSALSPKLTLDCYRDRDQHGNEEETYMVNGKTVNGSEFKKARADFLSAYTLLSYKIVSMNVMDEYSVSKNEVSYLELLSFFDSYVPEVEESVDPIYTASKWARDAITSALTKGFIPSDLQNNYKSVITRAEFCRLAVKWLEYKTGKNIEAIMVEKSAYRSNSAFSDTNDPDILAAYALGITSGTTAPTATAPGKFTPDGYSNREQAATMIRNVCKVANIDTNNVISSAYEDIVDASNWAIDSINFCYTNNIMNGTSTNPLLFSPKMEYTREQSIVMFDRIK